ncbi:MAG: hypothetical protein H6713_41150 [Myxococcales bacterium]|nr:hypothetical protein [Myxococcales bacterium]
MPVRPMIPSEIPSEILSEPSRAPHTSSRLGALARACALAGALAWPVACTGGYGGSTTDDDEATDSDGGSEGADDEDVIQCDPLDQACGDGRSCLPDGKGFQCMDYLVDTAGGLGDECGGPAECRPGLYCNTGLIVAGCSGAGCCASWCDLERADACGGVEKCLAWFTGAVPLGGEHIGICGVP